MTFVSVAEAARHLGIDVKTLRRWLADARFPLQSHPCDGRKKGMSQEHLQVLARQHQRSLASLPELSPTSGTSEIPPLPDVLLALPEQVSTLQAQIGALQQQIADLTLLLKPQAHSPERAAPTKPSKMSKHSPKPAPPAPGSRPVSKPPRKPVHVIPRVEYDKEGQYVVICPKHGLLPFEPDTEAWFTWVAEQDAFRFVGNLGHFSAHHEWHVPKGAWRAHRQIRNHSYNVRLALSQELTIAVLEQAAAALQAHLA
jgi:hypothetical protein